MTDVETGNEAEAPDTLVQAALPGLPHYITSPLEHVFGFVGNTSKAAATWVGERGERATSRARPWMEFIDFSAFGLADGGISAYVERLKLNAPYFMFNYVIVGLALTLLSVFTKPLALIGALVLVWLYFQFFGVERGEMEYEIWGFSFDAAEKLGIMVIIGFVVFWFTAGGLKIFVPILSTVVFVTLVHGVLRKPASDAIPSV